MHKKITGTAILIFIGLLIASCFIDGTGDDGDSINHYLFAHFAPKHPALYLHHWAKPLYVFIASLFAWAGFKGVVILNIILSSLSIFLCGLIAEKWKPGFGLVAMFIQLFSPLNFILIFSGLTEPLFAALLITGIYLVYIRQKYILAAAVLSFLPFVRSEGLMIICCVGVFLLLYRQYKAVIFLSLGSIVYSIIGFLSGKSFLWIFTEIPYSSAGSHYGSGKWWHFIDQLFYVTGLPIYIFLCLGIIYIFTLLFSKKWEAEQHILFLILTLWGVYFIAHSASWYLGIYNSMGLKRVLVGIGPLSSLIAVSGIFFIVKYFPARYHKKITWGTVVILIGFFFSGAPSAIHGKDITLSNSQLLAIDVASYLKKHTLINRHKVYTNYPYINYVLAIDQFDDAQYSFLDKNSLLNIQKNDIIIWDDWFSVIEGSITLDDLNSHQDIKLLKTFNKGQKNITVFESI